MKIFNLFKKKKSKFSLIERVKIYERAKKFYSLHHLDYYYGMCFCISESIGKLEYVLNKTNFPEFFALKPKNKKISEYWWDIEDYEIRIQMFDKLINDLNDEIYKTIQKEKSKYFFT